MRKIVIRKGFHYPFPFFPTALPFCVKKNKVNIRTRYVKFTDSCMFDLHDEDQHDVNKLYGFSIQTPKILNVQYLFSMHFT